MGQITSVIYCFETDILLCDVTNVFYEGNNPYDVTLGSDSLLGQVTPGTNILLCDAAPGKKYTTS